MPVLSTTVTLKLGSMVLWSPYRPVDMGWIGANDAPERISAGLSAYIVFSDDFEALKEPVANMIGHGLLELIEPGGVGGIDFIIEARVDLR